MKKPDTSYATTLAFWMLAMTFAASASAGGNGGRGHHGGGGHHGNVRSHAHHSHHRGYGTHYRLGGTSHGHYSSHVGRYVPYGQPSRTRLRYRAGYRALRPTTHYGSYRLHVPSTRIYRRPVSFYPQFYGSYPQVYSGYPRVYSDNAYVDDSAYAYEPYPSAAAPPAQLQPIYIIIQPAAAPAPAASAYEELAAPPHESAPAAAAKVREPGQVFVSVEPGNAAVYLDDDLLGSGEDVAEIGEPLVLASGVHVLEIVHPDFAVRRLVFGVPSAGKLRIEIDLGGDRNGRKSKVKPLNHGPVPDGN